ncbi:MAG: hypothetical protein IKA76_05540 [Clostridia bacterium]|nr:hypothetical protein [Clostridia bacterium]
MAFGFLSEKGFEGGAGVNDTTVWCQSRVVTEPAGETKSFRAGQNQKPPAKVAFFFLYFNTEVTP